MYNNALIIEKYFICNKTIYMFTLQVWIKTVVQKVIKFSKRRGGVGCLLSDGVDGRLHRKYKL